MITTIEQLKALSQWVGYDAQKVPKCPHTGNNASTNNPATWGTAAQAWEAKRRRRWAGIGYVFTIGAGVVGVDLDDCIDEAGQLSPFARDVVSILNSYTEISPSGHGIHVLVTGQIPQSIKAPGIEIYNELRYFTVTGQRLPNAPETINGHQQRLEAVYVLADGNLNKPDPLPQAPPRRQDITPEQIEAMLKCLPVHGDYNTFWLPVLMAVHSAYPDETGVQLIEAWSPGTRGEVRRKFHSFSATAKNGITIATLVALAKQHGYQSLRQIEREERPA